MHDIWNPWHGCKKISEGCQNCYMYYLDKTHNNGDSSVVTKTNSIRYPLQKFKDGSYKIKSGEHIRVCLTSDFFIEEADEWRDECWDVMRQRYDVVFLLLTKRPELVMDRLPFDFGDGWENVQLSVTCENQKRADERLPILLDLPFKHKGIMCAPFIGEVNVENYLASGQIEQVLCGGENYDGARPCNYDWVLSLSEQCSKHKVNFCFFETGNVFVKDGKTYLMHDKSVQSKMALKSGLSKEYSKIEYNLVDPFGFELNDLELYVPQYREKCAECGSRIICNGCSNCGACDRR